MFCVVLFFFKQKTAYEMRISDWSSDVCSSDLYGRTDLVSVIVDAIAVLLLEFPIFASGDVARLKLHLGIDASQLDALTRYEVQGQARPFLDIGLQVWPTAGYPIAGISQHQRLLRQAICILQSTLEIENMVRLSRQRRAIHEIVARGRQRPRTVGVRNGGV